MSAALATPPHKTWTRAEMDALQAAGLLTGTRFELIEGEVFDKMGQKPPHATAVGALVEALAAVFGIDRVRTQLPVEPSEGDAVRNLPEPDVAVTREARRAYAHRHPGPADILLIAEVSDTTYEFDARRKGHLYARAEFPEYLIVHLSDRELLVYRSPRDGVYTEIRVLKHGDTFSPLSAPESSIAVAELFSE
jgi:Uma2 family endonuclease